MDVRSLTQSVIILTLLIDISLASEHGKEYQSLVGRISNFTGRPTWSHRYTFPQSILRRAHTVSGDDHRMVHFMQRVIRGEEGRGRYDCTHDRGTMTGRHQHGHMGYWVPCAMRHAPEGQHG